MRPTSFTSSLLLALVVGSPAASAQIAGDVTYTGTESGKIFVEAFTETDATFEKLQTSMINPGPFSFENVEDGQYTVVAYIDANDNERIDSEEVWTEAGGPVGVPPGDSNVTLDLDSYVPPGKGGGEDSGGDEGCCRVVRAPRTPAAAVLLLALLLAARRR